jgi:cysteinyl-tRNA synthetase
MKLYNTLSRSLEEFKAIDPNNVRIYSCGVTVYGEPHIGNMRKYFLDDLLKNIIKHIAGYPTTHVVNITDVWHLTGENEWNADQGEDKMEKWARREGITARDVAKKYEQNFHQQCRDLLLDPFDINPRATDHIAEQIEMVRQLEQNWYTYIIPEDGIYMDTKHIEKYWELMGENYKKHIAWLQAGARIDDEGKRNATDFALRKFNTTWKKRDMERESPRGIGFPWWHIECSAMSIKYLGKHFDIHTGGIDHIPIHHTNEIAQSECSCSSSPWVNYWVHHQFLNIDGQKISKSLGNVVYLREIFEHWYSAYDLRYFFLQAHYRSFQDFTREGLEAASKARKNLKKLFVPYEDINPSVAVADDISYLTEVLLDDINTPKLLARLRAGHEAIDTDLAAAIRYLDEKVLKIWLFEKEQQESIDIPSDIQELAKQRRQAKLNQDRATADSLKQQIIAAGWEIKDGKDRYEITKD